ncbi:MAG: LytTR family DNA-binding domain-containing protein [Cyclobacteriaceae bacterium]|nr:LytTR family DNA-binding domain-containing protein [Cyclobacteriaceae bacterium]
MKHVVIVEDEPQAAQRLEKLLLAARPGVLVDARLESVEQGVEYFRSARKPDLIFMDIQLADGLSFEIFSQVEITSPVIFTTAFNEYALRAFKVNSIDYLLKPLDPEELERALRKYEALTGTVNSTDQMMASIRQAMEQMTRRYKERFVVKVGEHLRTVEVQEILYFVSLEKTTFAVTADGRRHILDSTLDQLEEMLSPEHFFRISRKYIVSMASITDMVSYVNSRLKLVLRHSDDDDVVVARERVQDFRNWLDR